MARWFRKPPPPARVPHPDGQVEAELQRMAATDRKIAPVSLSEELERATMICARSKQAVASMFNEARMGQTINTAGAQRMVAMSRECMSDRKLSPPSQPPNTSSSMAGGSSKTRA